MNRIVREHYPAARLPEDLRDGIDLAGDVRVTIEELAQPTGAPSLEEIFAQRRPPYRTVEEIDEEIRLLRGEWHERG